MPKYLVSYLGFPSCAAAAVALRHDGRARIWLTSPRRLAWSLAHIRTDTDAPPDIHLLGPGIGPEPGAVYDEINRIRETGGAVTWYCERSYLDKETEEHPEINWVIDHGSTLPELVQRNLEIPDDDVVRTLIELVRDEDRQHDWRDLLNAAILRFFNYEDYNAVPDAIRILAHPERLGQHHREDIQRFQRYGHRKLTGKSRALKHLRETIRKVGADPHARVLIYGETGTGKETVAWMIHEYSERKNAPFVPVNCANLPETLIESLLFGHEQGAFTGADTMRKGVFEHADGGTVFLDEVAELPLSAQAKLLRFLQEGTFYRLGGTSEHRVDIRILSATHRNLRREVQQGRFREDLYYRLNVVPIRVPPLRERREDIPAIIEDTLRRFAKTRSDDYRPLPVEQVRFLQECPWPGNVRQLENLLERSLVLGSTDMDQMLRMEAFDDSAADATLEAVERAHITRVYNAVGGNKSQTARILGISRNTLKSKLQKYGISET